MNVAITAGYAGLLGLLFVVLSARVILRRRGESVSLGDGGDLALQRRIRGHGNFAEYAPLTLLLMALAEVQGAAGLLVHLTGVLLLIGRLVHGYAFSRVEPFMAGRVGGMALTLTALLIAALVNIFLAIF